MRFLNSRNRGIGKVMWGTDYPLIRYRQGDLARLGPPGCGCGRGLATLSSLVGRKNDCVQALQRAYQAHLDGGETLSAARCAWVGFCTRPGGDISGCGRAIGVVGRWVPRWVVRGGRCWWLSRRTSSGG